MIATVNPAILGTGFTALSACWALVLCLLLSAKRTRQLEEADAQRARLEEAYGSVRAGNATMILEGGMTLHQLVHGNSAQPSRIITLDTDAPGGYFARSQPTFRKRLSDAYARGAISTAELEMATGMALSRGTLDVPDVRPGPVGEYRDEVGRLQPPPPPTSSAAALDVDLDVDEPY